MNRPDDSPPPSLAMDAEAFRSAGHALVDRVAEFLESVPDRPVTPAPTPDAVRAALRADAPLPEEGTDPETVLASATDLLFGHSLLNGHPRFFGYITSSPAPIGMLGDLLAAAVNANAGAWVLSPMATEIEAQTVRWIAELVGYPTDGGGLLVSGGNMANITALYAARTAALGPEVRTAGVGGAGAGRLLARGGTGEPGFTGGDGENAARPVENEVGSRRNGAAGGTPGPVTVDGLTADYRKPSSGRPRVYASAEAHTWLQKATDMAGLGTDAIRWIPTDADRRMDVDALRRTIAADRAAGDVAVMVVGSAGTVSTGAVDPLFEIARVCRELEVWFHVDGAYGAFAAAVPGSPPDLGGMALADSVAVDPHKWLYAPLEAGCVLVRDPATLRAAFSYHPPYYHFGTEATNYLDLGPQNSRGFRALKVWLALRQAGRRGYIEMIGGDIRLTERLFDRVEEDPELEACTCSLSIATFRYVPPDMARERGTAPVEAYLNLLNERLLDRIQASGEAFVSHAVLEGRYVLRPCIVNMNTREADVDAIPGIVTRLGRQVDSELRSQLDERIIAGRTRAIAG